MDTIATRWVVTGQLAKQIAENSSGSFGANTKKNPNEECKVVVTRSQRRVIVGDESKNNEGELGEEKENKREGEQMREKEISENEEAEESQWCGNWRKKKNRKEQPRTRR